MSTDFNTGDDIFRIHTGQTPASGISPAMVGNKAYGLLRMVGAGIRVPPGFVLGTTCCRRYFENDKHLPDSQVAGIQEHIRWLETVTGKGLGSKRNPLVLSVRSGAPVSMPGMMETLLNIGINDETVRGLIRSTGNPRLAWDSLRRLIQNYAEVVHATDPDVFDDVLKHCMKQEGLKHIDELDSVALRNLCTGYKHLYRSETGEDFPRDPWHQVYQAVSAVFDSWSSKRAVTYRKLNHIDPSTGTACLVESMVFGNAGVKSGSGVGFTRNPANGANELFIDYLANAQGEDIVSGRYNVDDMNAVSHKLPTVFSELQTIKQQLETEFSDMQDFEFTVQQGELFLLQTRNGKRTPMAGLHIAIDLAEEGIIATDQAIDMVDAIDLDSLYVSRLKQPVESVPLATGIIASTGVATGMIALDEDRCREYSAKGKPVVLVRKEISTNDIGAMSLVDSVVTVTGSKTSHAAVVARQLGIACIVGCHSLEIDKKRRCIHIGDQVFSEGDFLTVDADHGHLYAGQLDIEKKRPENLLKRIEEWRGMQPQQARSMDKIVN